jgi:hypothetical protein
MRDAFSDRAMARAMNFLSSSVMFVPLLVSDPNRPVRIQDHSIRFSKTA